MLVINKVLVVMFFYSIGLSGCAPSYSTWEGGLNEVIGDAFERHYKNPHSLFWAPIYSNKENLKLFKLLCSRHACSRWA